MTAQVTQHLEEYKTFEEWVVGTRPNRRELRRVCKKFGLLGARERGGRLAARQPARRLAYREIMDRAHLTLREADAADSLVAQQMLAAMEEMFNDEE